MSVLNMDWHLRIDDKECEAVIYVDGSPPPGAICPIVKIPVSCADGGEIDQDSNDAKLVALVMSAPEEIAVARAIALLAQEGT